MKLFGLNILLVSPEAWEHIMVSKHHYAVHLAKQGNRVFFLGPPSHQLSVDSTGFENVSSVSYRGFARGLRFYPRFLQTLLMRRKFEMLQRMCKVNFDVIWSFDNSVFYNFSFLPKSVVKISHVVDLTQNFQLSSAARTADLCLGSSAAIVSSLKQHNPFSYFVQHGYADVIYEKAIALPGQEFSVKVGYAGNLQLKYIDWKLVRAVIDQAPQVAFYFAGPYVMNNETLDWMSVQGNVFLLGEIPGAGLKAFCQQMDILLICYLADEFSAQVANPHKMMQYLGSGTMIVATYTAEYQALEDRELLLMATHNNEFRNKFLIALNRVKFWNDPEKRRLRIQFAMDNTYVRQLERIEALLQERLDVDKD